MTTIRQNRCIHCGTPYSYMTSGFPPGTVQSSRYCPECHGAVREALQAIPAKRVKVWVPIQGVSLETLQGWEQENARGSFLPNIRRIGVGLVDTETGAFQVVRIVRGRDDHQYRTFQYSYWPGKEDEVEVQEEMARHVETGEITPWDIRRNGWQPLGPADPEETELLPEYADCKRVRTGGNKTMLVGPIKGGALPEYGES